MKSGMEMPALADELTRQANAKRDFVTRADSMRVASNGHTTLHMNEPFDVSETGHDGIARYLEVPKSFYDRLRGKTEELVVCRNGGDAEAEDAQQAGSPLFDVMVNTLLQGKGDDRRLVRTLDGKARAVLSTTYSVDYDSLDVYRACVSAMEKVGLTNDDVASCSITETHFYMKIVSPKIEAVIRPGNVGPGGMLAEPQVVRAGVAIRNSEVGMSSLSIQPLVFKLACSNGLIVEEGLRRRHVGRELGEGDDGAVYRTDTQAAEAVVRLLKVRDLVANAIDPERFRKLADRIQQAAETRLTAAPERCVEVTASRFGLSDQERERVLQAYLDEGVFSHWSLIDAITSVANTAASYDRATVLESVGGRLLSLGKSDLRDLVEAR